MGQVMAAAGEGGVIMPPKLNVEREGKLSNGCL